jgi:cytosine/creatinine deaminase
MDLIVRRTRLQSGEMIDIGVIDGRIVALETQIGAVAAQELDAGGRLTLPAFVNGQLHACKSFWRRLLHTLPTSVRSMPRFEAAAHVKRLYTVEDVFARVDEVMRMAILNGTCAIRLFADVDADSGLTALDALLRIREKYRPLMTVQVVAFPQDGFAAPGAESLMRQALEMGADVVGGIPWIEASAEAQRRHTEACFALAQTYDRDLHFVCDDVADPQSRSLEYVAQQTLAHDFHGRVSATQCAALAFYPDDYAAQVIDTVAAAEVTIFSNSHISLIATDFPPQQPWPRGITRVHELLDAGVPVACGQDDIDNWFYPFGRNDLLEVAQFMAHNGQFVWNGEVERVLPMITTTPARVLGLDDYGLQIGAAANILVLDAADWHEAIQFQADKRFVILRGNLAAQTERRGEIFPNLL